MEIIAFNGPFKSGKSLHAAKLAEIDPRYKVYPLAAELKADLASQHGISVEEMEADKATYRPEMQSYGDHMKALTGRPTYWVERMVSVARKAGDTHLLVPDVRYHYEALGLERVAGIGHFFLVKLLCPTEVVIERYVADHGVPPTPEQLSHPSETEWDYQLAQYASELALHGQSPLRVYQADCTLDATLRPVQIGSALIDALGTHGFDFRIGGQPVAEAVAAFRKAHPSRRMGHGPFVRS